MNIPLNLKSTNNLTLFETESTPLLAAHNISYLISNSRKKTSTKSIKDKKQSFEKSDTHSKSILKDCSVELRTGKSHFILGENGAGKSSLLHILSGGRQPTHGSVTWLGEDLAKLDEMEQSKHRSYLTQNGEQSFDFSVLDWVMLGRQLRGESPVIQKRIASTVLHWLDAESLLDQSMFTLSGGERQRVNLAQALIQIADVYANEVDTNQTELKPPLHVELDFKNKLLILDEPTSAMDLKFQMKVFELLEQLKQKGLCILAVVHDVNLAVQFGDFFILMKSGRVVEQGDFNDVIHRDNLMKLYEVDVVEVCQHDKVDETHSDFDLFSSNVTRAGLSQSNSSQSNSSQSNSSQSKLSQSGFSKNSSKRPYYFPMKNENALGSNY